MNQHDAANLLRRVFPLLTTEDQQKILQVVRAGLDTQAKKIEHRVRERRRYLVQVDGAIESAAEPFDNWYK